MATSPPGRARRWLTPLLLPFAMLFVLIESTVWRWLTAIGRELGRLSLFAALERLVERLSPGAVIAVFVLPFVPIIPLLKLGEFWLLAHHHYVWAAVVIVGTKVVGAAFSTRVFAVARPKMLQVRWFAWTYGQVVWLLDIGHRALQAIPGWVAARAMGRRAIDAVRAAMARQRGPLSRGFAAARRWVRARFAR